MRAAAAAGEESDEDDARASAGARRGSAGAALAGRSAASASVVGGGREARLHRGQKPAAGADAAAADPALESTASEREAARVRKASRLLAHSSDEESDSGRSRPAHRQPSPASAPPPAPPGPQRPAAGSVGVPDPAPAAAGGAKAAKQASSLQRVRDLTSEDAAPAALGYAHARRERVTSVSSRVAHMLRHSSPAREDSPAHLADAKAVVSSDSDEDPSAPKKHAAARRAGEADEGEEGNKPRRPTASEVAEALRKKRKSQMAIADCLKQKAARVPVLRVLARSLGDVTGRLVRCPDNLSSRTSSVVQGNIVFVGDDMTKVRPAAAVGASAIVLVSGTDIPQGVDVDDIAGDVKVPVVAVSQAGREQLTMGASTTLMFSNSIGGFSPEAKQLLRPKNPVSWRKQRDSMRSGDGPVLSSVASSLHVEESTANSGDSDSSPAVQPRRLPVSHKKSERSVIGDRGLSPETAPAPQVPIKPIWHALVDFEIKESFEVLDSPQKDATMASMFGMVEIDEAEDMDDALRNVPPKNMDLSAAPADADASAPTIIADVVCVTPGLSVTNVYNELQAQSMHRGRTPADHRMPSRRHADESGSENIDPQTEDASPPSPPPALALHTDPGGPQHLGVSTADNVKSGDKPQMPGLDLASATTQGTHSHQLFFDQEPSAMAGFVARLGASSSSTPEAQEESISTLYSGILSRIASKSLESRQDGLARLRELCRYKSSAFAQKLVHSLFTNADVRGVLASTLEPGAYDSVERARQQEAKLSAAACFRHLAIDPTMGRVLAGDTHIMGALGRSLNEEMVATVRHTVAGCLANLSVQDDENRRLVCGYPEVLKGLQLMMENTRTADSDKHLETALAALSNLSMNNQCAGPILEHVQVETLVEAVQSHSVKSQIRAVRIIRNLARSQDGHERVVSARGVTDALNHMLGSAEPEAKTRAQEALNVIQSKSLPPSAKASTPKISKRGVQGQLAPSNDAATLQVCICEAYFDADNAQAVTHGTRCPWLERAVLCVHLFPSLTVSLGPSVLHT